NAFVLGGQSYEAPGQLVGDYIAGKPSTQLGAVEPSYKPGVTPGDLHAAKQIAGTRKGQSVDFRLSFESARSLFSDLTPARLDLLDTLRRVGPCSVYALAKATERNYSNVHTDIARLEELSLVERNADDTISVPFESIEILVPLAQVA
ncbi:MAG: MarR family transcriptional regulator, partial [Burkholderiales bacterium]